MSARFCASCGTPLVSGIPSGEDRERLCCPACSRIHYENPRVDVACVLDAEDGALRLLLVPLASGERIQGAAMRALGAEAPVGITEEGLGFCCALTDIPAGRVCLIFRARRVTPVAEVAAAGGLPAWGGALLRHLARDREERPATVYTAAWDGTQLRLAAVPRD